MAPDCGHWIGMRQQGRLAALLSASSNQHKACLFTNPNSIEPAPARANIINVIKYWIKPRRTACERGEKAVVATLATHLITSSTNSDASSHND